MHYNDGFSQRTYWTPDEVRSRFDELEAGNVKHGPSDGRVWEQHHLQTHLGNPGWVKGYQDQPHQPGPAPQEGAPTHYERTHPNGFVERQSADLVNKVLRTGDPRGKEQWHMDEHGNVHTHHEDGTSGVFRPVTASGLGMPDGPMTPPTDPTGVDQAVDPQPGAIKPEVQPFEQFMAPVPTNQTTTKPRQMPGGGSAPGLGGDVTMDPATNGSDLGENTESAQPPSDDFPPTQAKRHQAYILADVMADVLEGNPGLGERTAYLLAKRTVEEFDLVKHADSEGWNPLNYGNRGKVPDAPFGVKVPRVTRTPLPAESPSVHQPTVQPEHARAISGSPAGGGAIGSPPGAPKALPPGNDPLSPLDFLLDEDDEKYSQTIKMRQGDDQVWRAARKAAQR